MGKLGKSGRSAPFAVWQKALFGVGGAFVAVGVYFLVQWLTRDSVPDLPLTDVNTNNQAGLIASIKGKAQVRTWVPEEEITPDLPVAPLRVAEVRGTFPLGTLFKVEKDSAVQTWTVGDWLVSVEDEGEFVFEDARKNDAGTIHVQNWILRRGTMRIKVADNRVGVGQHILVIHLALGRIILREGELGIGFVPGVGGRIWIREGDCVLLYRDGRRRPLSKGGFHVL